MDSLRSRRLEVVGTRKNARERTRHARGEGAQSPLECLPRARPFSVSPTTSKLRRLENGIQFELPCSFPPFGGHGTRILKPSKFKLLLVFCLKIQILFKFLGFLDTLRIFTDLNGENKSPQYHRQQHLRLWLMVHWSTPPPHSPLMELQVSPT